MKSTEFKIGSYIVLLKTCGNGNIYYYDNHVYKQNETLPYLSTENDSYNSKTNSWQWMNASRSTGCDWRYATPMEIAAYDQRKGPVDVTSINEHYYEIY